MRAGGAETAAGCCRRGRGKAGRVVSMIVVGDGVVGGVAIGLGGRSVFGGAQDVLQVVDGGEAELLGVLGDDSMGLGLCVLVEGAR